MIKESELQKKGEFECTHADYLGDQRIQEQYFKYYQQVIEFLEKFKKMAKEHLTRDMVADILGSEYYDFKDIKPEEEVLFGQKFFTDTAIELFKHPLLYLVKAQMK